MAGSEGQGSLDGSLADAALWYASRGFAVFPLKRGSKLPATPHGHKDATCDTDGFAERWGDRNVGVACGSASGGLLVIDCDVSEDKDGCESLRAWERLNTELPDTWMANTPSGGVHYLYRLPAGASVRNSVSQELGVDIRCDGGYIVAPPSKLPNGEYVFEQHPDDYDLAEADATVMAFVEWLQKRSSDVQGGPYELPEVIASGGRNDELYRYGCSLRAKETPALDIIERLGTANRTRCKPPLPEDEMGKLIDSVLSLASGCSPEVKALKGGAESEDEPLEPEDGEIPFDRDGRGKVKQTISNAKLAIEEDPLLHGHFYHDEMLRRDVCTLPLPWDGGEGDRPVCDTDAVQMTAYFETRHDITRKTIVDDAITAVCADHARNPCVEWLESLTWDGTERLRYMLPALLGAEVSDYNCEVSRMLLLSAVARVFEPGVKCDYMAVLIGRQGLGKSYFLRRLVPREEWFVDGLDTIEGKEAVEIIQGAVIVEVAELLATKRAKDVRMVKSFVTKRVDNYREAYGKRKAQVPRTCVLVGTTNDHSFLTDRTGNRRFLPVECGVNEMSVDLFGNEAWDYIEQCWAEAVRIWKEERPALVMPRRLAGTVAAMQDEHTEDDPRAAMVSAYINEKPVGSWVSVPEVCERALDMDIREWRDSKVIKNEVAQLIQNTGLVTAKSTTKQAASKRFGRQKSWQIVKHDEGEG